jgi:transposase InsO family protein
MTDPELVALPDRIKTELIHRKKWHMREGARAAIYNWIEKWYSRKRLHSTVGYRSPDDFENEEKRIAALSQPYRLP